MSGRLAGEVAVVTGSTHGIGRATAEAFIAAGARAVLVDRDLDEAKKAAAALGNAEAHALDVTHEAEVDGFFAGVTGRSTCSLATISSALTSTKFAPSASRYSRTLSPWAER